MPDHPPDGEARRRFLGRLGATLAAGLGLTAFGASAAGAGRRPDVAPAPSAEASRPSPRCAIYCYTYSCPGGCAAGRNLFRCVDRCSGTWYYCLQHSCSNFCYSTNIC